MTNKQKKNKNVYTLTSISQCQYYCRVFFCFNLLVQQWEAELTLTPTVPEENNDTRLSGNKEMQKSST